MLELILYNLSSSWILLTIFFIVLFVIGCTIFLLTKKFNLTDGRIKLYGLLLNINDKDVIILSVIIVRAFLIIYSILFYNSNIYMYLTMIGIISIILIIVSFKDIIYELINTCSLMALIYFNHTLSNYVIEVENSNSVQMIKIILITFAILYTIYILLRGFEDITSNNKNIKE